MVRYIRLAIPPGMEDVYNPIEDAALMKQIGAKRSDYYFTDKTVVGSIHELKDVTTGATYEFLWWCKDSKQYFRIKKIEQSAT